MLQKDQTKALLLRLSATAPRSRIFRHSPRGARHQPRHVLFKPETGLPPAGRRALSLRRQGALLFATSTVLLLNNSGA